MSKTKKVQRPGFSLAIGGKKTPEGAQPANEIAPEKVTEGAVEVGGAGEVAITHASVTAPVSLPATENTSGKQIPNEIPSFFNMDREVDKPPVEIKPEVSSARSRELEIAEIAEKESKKPTSLRLTKDDYIIEEMVFRESKFKSKQQMRHTMLLNGLKQLAADLNIKLPEQG